MGERAHSKADAAPRAAISAAIDLGANAAPIKLGDQCAQGSKFKIAGENGPHGLGLAGHDHELLVHAAVAEWHRSPNPDSLTLGGGNLVAHSFPDHLSLKLGKGQQHIKGEPPHAGGGIERLGHRYERYQVLV